MSFTFRCGPFEQDAADRALDAEAEVVSGEGQDDVLLDYAVRLAKEIVAAAPIVSTHLMVTIDGNANANGTVYEPGSGRPPYLLICVGAPSMALEVTL